MITDKLKYFLMFAGYPRSGHTLVASMLNAHPNVMISNQLFILKNIEQYTQETLFNDIKLGSREGIWKSEVKIPSMPKQSLSVIGDKTGHRTMELLGGYKTLLPFYKEMQNGPAELSKLKEIVGVPVKWIHVVRNPYDNLATWTKKNFDNRKARVPRLTIHDEFNTVFQKYKELNEKIVELNQAENVLCIAHEKVIRFIDRSLNELCEFLEIEKFDQWRANCIKTKWDKPRETRGNIKWTPDMRAKVANLIRQYPWLSGYDMGRGG